jgi:hypothetical protein
MISYSIFALTDMCAIAINGFGLIRRGKGGQQLKGEKLFYVFSPDLGRL